jgi:hypothetical protein
MAKREVLAVLQEIRDLCKKGWIITCISLDCHSSQISPDSSNNYQIKMKCALDEKSKNCLRPILEHHKLNLYEENGFVTLFSRK